MYFEAKFYSKTGKVIRGKLIGIVIRGKKIIVKWMSRPPVNTSEDSVTLFCSAGAWFSFKTPDGSDC